MRHYQNVTLGEPLLDLLNTQQTALRNGDG